MPQDDQPVGLREVGRTVGIEVGEDGAEARAPPTGVLEAAARDRIGEQAALVLTEERVELLGEMRDEEVAEPVPVAIGEGRAHVRRGTPHGVEGQPAQRRLFAEGAVVLVDEEPVRAAVVGAEDVGPSVAVEIRAD